MRECSSSFWIIANTVFFVWSRVKTFGACGIFLIVHMESSTWIFVIWLLDKLLLWVVSLEDGLRGLRSELRTAQVMGGGDGVRLRLHSQTYFVFNIQISWYYSVQRATECLIQREQLFLIAKCIYHFNFNFELAMAEIPSAAARYTFYRENVKG